MPIGLLARKFLAEVTRRKQRWSPARWTDREDPDEASGGSGAARRFRLRLGSGGNADERCVESDIEYSCEKIAADLRKDRAKLRLVRIVRCSKISDLVISKVQ